MRIALTALLLAAAAGAQTGTPSIFQLTPASVRAGAPTFALTINGANFTAGSVVLWNGALIPASVRSVNELAISVPAHLVATPGIAFLSVRNPDGQVSLAQPLTITQITPPTIGTASLPAATVGASYSAALAATSGTPPYVWSAEALPQGLSLSTTGMWSGVPVAAGTFDIRVRVIDAAQSAATATLRLVVSNPALSVATVSPLQPATTRQPYSVTLQSAGGIPPVRWTVSGTLPPGFTLNPETGVVSGTPPAPGNFQFTAQVTDSAQTVATRPLMLRVNPAPLEITTIAPLFSGTVGLPYAQTFAVSGGTPPYRWALRGPAGGLTFDAATGTLQGTPAAAGTLSFTVDVTDTAGATASKDFTIVVSNQAPVITTVSPLPAATAGAVYTTGFSAVRVSPPQRWRIVTGGLPGMVLDTGTGVLTYAAPSPGTFPFTVEVRGNDEMAATKTFSLTVNPAALTIAGGAQTFSARLSEPVREVLSASGGVPPYTWSANGLPDGIGLEPDGTLAGVPAIAGSVTFTVRVIDANRTAFTELFRLNIALPALPAVEFPGVPGTTEAAEQLAPSIRIAAPYPTDLSGELLITLSPDVGGGDATVQFSTGARSAAFRIPAGQTTAAFAAPDLRFQTGTVAGVVGLTARMQAFGVDATPAVAPSHRIRIDRAPPVITSVRTSRATGTLDVEVTGYSTAREITQARFVFRASGDNELQTSEIAPPVEDIFAAWFSDIASSRFGSQFRFTQRFNIQGDVSAVQLTSVTFTNREGSTTHNLP